MTAGTFTVVAVDDPGGSRRISVFPTATAAVRFAVLAQHRQRQSCADSGLAIGVAIGELSSTDPQPHGRVVEEASALCHAAGPGRILSSPAVRLVAGSLDYVTFQPAAIDTASQLSVPAEADEIVWADSQPSLRVLLVDDAVLIRQGIAGLLRQEGFEVVGETADIATLPGLVDDSCPDLIVTDVRMPPTFTTEGLEAAIQIRRGHPDIAVVVLSQHLETRYAVELLGNGARGVGYLLKERVGAVEDFVVALRRVATGGTAIDPEVIGLLMGRSERSGRLERLSPRENDILALMAQGLSNPGIARRLSVGLRTVESHIASVFTKLGLLPDQQEERRVLAVIEYLRRTPSDTTSSP